MLNIFGMDLAELNSVLKPYNLPNYRAKQIAEWLYRKSAASFADMTNLSLALRQKLSADFCIARPHIKDRLNSADGKTIKYLLEFADGTAVETVLMQHPYGNSVCVSTQAGCAMGCVFCASTLHGRARNLTAGEILSQVIIFNDLLQREQNAAVDTIVIMGSGEPLENYDNVLKFIRLVHEPYTLNIGYRNITLSTSGIVPNMLKLATENIPISLAVSLHAPNNDLRSKIMPINRKYPLSDVVQAAKNYADKTGRRITYEYILIADLNDSGHEAAELASLLRGQLASVNLIPINPVLERNLLRPSQKRIMAFENYLQSKHINVTLRREMGTDIQAACGQLRNKHIQKKS